jgi:hypothetical protein
MTPIGTFAKELFRRKVVRVVGAYLAIFWAVTLGLASLFPALGVPDIVFRVFVIVGLAAVPLIAFVSWRYDIVPPQLIRDVQDVALENPGLSWARVRHDNKDAGYVLLTWTHDGNRSEKRFFQPVSIGREATNDVELGDERVSRHHAVLWAEAGIWHVRDLDSANGTFIGHSRVSGHAPLPQTCDLRFHVNGPIVSVHVAKSAATRVG